MLTQNFIFALLISLLSLLPMALLCLLYRLNGLNGRRPDVDWYYISWTQLVLVMVLAQVVIVPLVSAQYAHNVDNTPFIETRTALLLQNYEAMMQGTYKPLTDLPGAATLEDFPIEAWFEPEITVSGLPTNVRQWPGWPYLARLWLGVVVLLLIGRMAAYLAFQRHLRRNSRPITWQAIPLPEPETDKMRWAAPRLTLRQQNNDAPHTAPFVTGLFKPCLVVPAPEVAAELTARDWQHLLGHELAHYRRHDVWCKWLVMLWQCLYWFNPAVYPAGRLIEQFCEIRCDLEVAGAFSEERRRDYMRTVLRIVSGSAAVSGHKLYTGMNDDKQQIKRRFEMLSKPKNKNTPVRRVLAGLLSTLLIYAMFTACTYAAWETGNFEPAGSDRVSMIVVSNGGDKINLVSEPFVDDNGEIYLPLRETLEKFSLISAGDNGSLQYQDGVVKLELKQWLNDAAGGQVLHTFYIRQFSLNDSTVGAQMRDDVIYVPVSMLLGMAQMSAASGGGALDGLMVMAYDAKNGEVLRLVSLPLPTENKAVNMTLPLAEKFAVVPQFLQAWQQGDYQKMQSFCYGDALDKDYWQNAAGTLGTAAAVYAEQRASTPNSLFLHVLIKRPDGGSSYSELALELEVAQQSDGGWLISSFDWLISSFRGSQRDATPLSGTDELYWQWPVQGENRLISSGYDGERQHSGIDIPASYGTPVYAAAAGLVQAAGYMGADGNKVILQHPAYGAWETRYAHLSGIAVKAGDTVAAGQVIGYVGSTGSSTGNHLHFAILRDGQTVDPLPFFE